MVDKKTKAKVIAYWKKCGNLSETLRKYPVCSRTTFYTWLKEKGPKKRKGRSGVLPPGGRPSAEEKLAIIKRCFEQGEPVLDVSIETGISRMTIYKWYRLYKADGIFGLMGKRNNRASPEKGDGDLAKRIDEMQLQIDILKETIEVLKKDPGINLGSLKAKEKAAIVDALRGKHSLPNLLRALGLGKSSYYYARKARSKPDKYLALRELLKRKFAECRLVYGYRRMKEVALACGFRASEKVIRRIMAEEGLTVRRKRVRKYSSYLGELSPAEPNLINRDFAAEKPFEKILTDITEFGLSDGKVYLSPAIDCYDGMPLAWSIGTAPSADLANSMLKKLIGVVPDGSDTIVHSDRGCHYRWPGWIAIMEGAGFRRSMSKKGCSPDNSACEGFFGTIKNEMFHNTGAASMKVKEFIPYLEEYLRWFREERLKESLGFKSPIANRKAMGIPY